MAHNFFLSSYDKGSVLELLRLHGIVVLKNFVSENDIHDLKTEFDNFFTSNSDAIYMKHKHPTNKEGRVARCKRGLLGDEFGVTKKMFSDPFMYEIAKAYFQPFDFVLNDDIFITHELPCEVPILPWHYDRTQALKFYIYLKDTTVNDGAFEYCPGTQREGRYRASYHLLKGTPLNLLPNDIPEDEIINPVAIEGQAGDLLIFDPDGFHRGGVVGNGGERKVMRGHSHAISDIESERIWSDMMCSGAVKNRDDGFAENNRF